MGNELHVLLARAFVTRAAGDLHFGNDTFWEEDDGQMLEEDDVVLACTATADTDDGAITFSVAEAAATLGPGVRGTELLDALRAVGADVVLELPPAALAELVADAGEGASGPLTGIAAQTLTAIGSGSSDAGVRDAAARALLEARLPWTGRLQLGVAFIRAAAKVATSDSFPSFAALGSLLSMEGLCVWAAEVAERIAILGVNDIGALMKALWARSDYRVIIREVGRPFISAILRRLLELDATATAVRWELLCLQALIDTGRLEGDEKRLAVRVAADVERQAERERAGERPSPPFGGVEHHLTIAEEARPILADLVALGVDAEPLARALVACMAAKAARPVSRRFFTPARFGGDLGVNAIRGVPERRVDYPALRAWSLPRGGRGARSGAD